MKDNSFLIPYLIFDLINEDKLSIKNIVIKIIKSMLNGKDINYENSDLSKREWNELMETLELKNKII